MKTYKLTQRFRPVIRVFVSSTFSDTMHERNALVEKVYPKLEQLCQKQGFQFQAIDLRWGISSEAGLDHRAMRICFDELQRTQEISPKPNFLILLGDRYGWRPLPEEISVREFNVLEDIALANSYKHAKVLRSWYCKDENAIPPVYTLQSRRQDLGDGQDYTEDAAWGSAQEVLWRIINRAMPPEALQSRFEGSLDSIPPIVRFQASATEQEIWQGALQVRDAREHVIAFFREIKNLSEFCPSTVINDFVDVAVSGGIDLPLAAEQHRLKKALVGRLVRDNVFRPAVPVRLVMRPDETGTQKADITTDHLGAMCTDIEKRLTEIIQVQIDDYWNRTLQGSPERAERELEIEQGEHKRFGSKRGGKGSFIGRESELKRVRDYLKSNSRQPLVVHGSSGCGKTALMWRSFDEISEARKPIIRFIGATPHSSDARSLLGSLCQELRRRHSRKDDLPTDIMALQEELNEQLHVANSEKPLILFLDALDQLSDADNGRLLNWIPLGQLPSHVKLIVSCLSERDEDDPEGQPWIELRRRQFPETSFINLDVLSEDQARTLLFDRWLQHQAGRRLNQHQKECIGERLASPVCRQPIYLKLLFEEVRLWRSYDAAPQLGEDVSALIGEFVERLSQPANHGPLLVERLLGYLAASRHGLAENEILEILFTDPEYKAKLNEATKQTRHKLPANATRIPTAIWSRIRFDLSPYLTERAAPGANVLNFYHRQVMEWVRLRDLGQEQMIWPTHKLLADFFEKKADPAEDSTWKTTSSRALEELPYHLAQDQDVSRWERTLCDPLFVESSCRAGLVFDILRDIDAALIRLSSAPVQLIRDAVASSLRTITSHPEFCLSIICNRLSWAESNELIVQAEARAVAVLDTSGPWLQAASALPVVESIPLADRFLQAFIAERQAFASFDESGIMEIRSIETGKLLTKRTLPSRALIALAVEPVQLLAVWLDRHGNISAESSKSVFPGRALETKVAYPRNDAVIAVSRDGDLVVWNPRSNETTVLAKSIQYPLVVLQPNPDGSRILFVAGDRSSAQTLGIASMSGCGWVTNKISWNGSPVKHACLNPDGTRALLVDSSRRMSIVEVTSGTVLASTQYERRSDAMAWGAITACALGKEQEDETAVVTTDKGEIWVWDWKQDRFTACGKYKGLQESDAIRLLEILPKGSRIFLSTANRAAFFSMGREPSAVHHSAAVTDCTITESGLVASVCREERVLKWWHFEGLVPLRSFPVETPLVVVADGNDDCVFLGTDGGLLYRFPASQQPESKNIYRLFDHPVANIVSDRPGVAIAASTQGLIERVDFVADHTDWLCSHTFGQRQRWLLPRAGGAYITVRKLDAADGRNVVALGTGGNMEEELYKSIHSSILVTASRQGEYLAIYDRSVKVFKLEGGKLISVFTAEANSSVCAVQLFLGDKYLLLAQRDEPWLELRRLEPRLPLAAVMELPSAPSCLCVRQDRIAVGFLSGDILCVRVRDNSLAKSSIRL